MAHRQLSLLAVAEAVLSTALVWWWARHTSYPFWSCLTTLAVPLLLLRSPQSVRRGKALLKIYLTREQVSAWVGVVSVVVAALAGWACYELYRKWFPEHTGWAIWWRSVMAVEVVFLVAHAVAAPGRKG